MSESVRVLLVGAGHMGASHGRALASMPDFELAGIVTRGDSGARLADELGGVAHYRDFGDAFTESDPTPDAVAIASYAETHVPFTRPARSRPVATCSSRSRWQKPSPMPKALVATVTRARIAGVGRRLHPAPPSVMAGLRLSSLSELGKPLVMRMNLNQQSQGAEWATHRSIMATTSPTRRLRRPLRRRHALR